MTSYAHSEKGDIPAQEYGSHISGVHALASKYLHQLAPYNVMDHRCLQQHVHNAVVYHDLGKLNQSNQEVLSGKVSARNLPVHHQDAGVAFLQERGEDFFPAYMAICAHHIGYQDLAKELIREDRAFRDEEDSTVAQTDVELPAYLSLHQKLTGLSLSPITDEIKGDPALFLRMLLSCLADADHTDTARNYKMYPSEEVLTPLRAGERLKKLDQYVSNYKLREGDDLQRHSLRKQMYGACRNTDNAASVVSCDSPVGSGKTTAVMANLLNQAVKRGLRRIFVVLPFTNIIKQSVTVYRKALVLPGENEEDVVAELHHRADFQSMEARHLTAQWRAPIIVTTAVAFFETLASNMPSGLRRLHELPGSAVFVDESHAALPIKLLPIAWKWIQALADEWSCCWVLASGSLTRFWEIPEIGGTENQRFVPEMIDDSLRKELSLYEHRRITYMYDREPKTLESLGEWIHSFEGPRLVIMNTIHSAAMLADHLSKTSVGKVEHLSTALKASDREITLKRIKQRLADKNDKDWTLVATSCVEAGVDFSFKVGFREIASLLSLLQAAGRVDREGIYKTSQMWTFCIAEDEKLRKNPGLEQAATVLKGFFENEGEVSADKSTLSIVREIYQYGVDDVFRQLLEKEMVLGFKYVADHFQVIDSDSEIVVVDSELINALRQGANVDWKLIQRESVQISRGKLRELKIPRIIMDGIYAWNLEYDQFLGYMAGVISYNHAKHDVLVGDDI